MFVNPAEVLLKDKANNPILRRFRDVFPTRLLEDFKSWLSQRNNKEVAWDSTMNPYRLSTWLVAPPCTCTYTYGGKTWEPAESWPKILDVITKRTEQALQPGPYFNAAVLNAYMGGQGAVAMHTDDEYLFDAATYPATIASLSIGETRDFEVQDVVTGTLYTYAIQSGDLVTMEGLFQKSHKHAVPKSKAARGIRYNLTLRRIVNHERHCSCFSYTPSTTPSSLSETPVE